MEQQYSTKPTILNKHLAEEIGRKAPLSSKLPHQVSEPRIVTHQKGYGGFHTKQAQQQARERDFFLEEQRKAAEAAKLAKKSKKQPKDFLGMNSMTQLVTNQNSPLEGKDQSLDGDKRADTELQKKESFNESNKLQSPKLSES